MKQIIPFYYHSMRDMDMAQTLGRIGLTCIIGQRVMSDQMHLDCCCNIPKHLNGCADMRTMQR